MEVPTCTGRASGRNMGVGGLGLRFKLKAYLDSYRGFRMAKERTPKNIPKYKPDKGNS